MNDDVMYLCRDIKGGVHIVRRTDLLQRSSVYGVIKNQDGVLLVCDRTSDSRWDLPGGGVETGEDILTALHREISEETALTIEGQPSKICDFIEYFYDIESKQGWESHRYFYSVETNGVVREGGNQDDIVDVRYFSSFTAADTVAPVAREVISQSRV